MRIINNRKPNNWVKFDRALMRDTRLKSPQKVLYLLFCSLSESMDSVYPSYAWIAEEVGYQYTGQAEKGSKDYESAMQQFIAYNLKPLIDLGWIKKTNNKGASCDYEVYDHDCGNPQEKSSDTPKKNLRGNPQEKSSTRYKNIISYIEEDIELDSEVKEKLLKWVDERNQNKKLPSKEAVNIAISKLNKFSTNTQIAMIENSILNGWTGIFPISEPKNKNQATKTEYNEAFYPPSIYEEKKSNTAPEVDDEYLIKYGLKRNEDGEIVPDESKHQINY